MTQPFNFSWFVEGKLAGMGYPEDTDIPFLADAGIKTLVNIDPYAPDYIEVAEEYDVAVCTIQIYEFCPPSIEQIQQFLKIVDDAQGVSQNCSAKDSVICHVDLHLWIAYAWLCECPL